MIYEGNSVIAYRSNSRSARAVVKHESADRSRVEFGDVCVKFDATIAGYGHVSTGIIIEINTLAHAVRREMRMRRRGGGESGGARSAHPSGQLKPRVRHGSGRIIAVICRCLNIAV